MKIAQTPHPADRATLWVALATAVAALVAGCATPLPPPPAAPPMVQPPMTPPPVVVAPPPPEAPVTGAISRAQTPREYRTDAAGHLYALNANRIYKGKLPPLLYAVGVLQVHVDKRGMVSSLSWMRAPTHAPEVIAEIERTVRSAQPYPVAVQLGRVTYTDTWLWDRSGFFQLDTLTEGQLGEMPPKGKRVGQAELKEVNKVASRSAKAKAKGGTLLAAESCGTPC